MKARKRPEHRSPSALSEDADAGDWKHRSGKELGRDGEAEYSQCARASPEEQQQ